MLLTFSMETVPLLRNHRWGMEVFKVLIFDYGGGGGGGLLVLW